MALQASRLSVIECCTGGVQLVAIAGRSSWESIRGRPGAENRRGGSKTNGRITRSMPIRDGHLRSVVILVRLIAQSCLTLTANISQLFYFGRQRPPGCGSLLEQTGQKVLSADAIEERFICWGAFTGIVSGVDIVAGWKIIQSGAHSALIWAETSTNSVT